MKMFIDVRAGEISESLKQQQISWRRGIKITLPAIVQSFNASAVTVDVQVSLKGYDESYQRDITSIDYPILQDIPVVFPRGGGATLTFPISVGDECIVIFSSKSIDFWHQSGSIQETSSPREYDLTDAFAFVGAQSQAKKISGISTSSVQLRSDDGASYFELIPSSQTINIVAPGGFNVKAPISTFSDQVVVNGLLSYLAGMVGKSISGAAAKISGAVEFIGSLTSNGKNISDSHTHKGVRRGGDNTGGVD